MEILRPATLSLLSVLVLFISWRVTFRETFHQCLLKHSQPSYPISEAVFTPQNSSYSAVLQSYIRNLRFNTSSTPKPLLIIAAFHESHVQAAIICAQKHAMQMKIRSGGHDFEGLSYVSNNPYFFLLDMFNLRSIDIDIKSETAWVQTGATLGEVLYQIAEKSKIHGFPVGVCPTVGVGGHLSAGGYGNMMRKYGMSIDNIIDAKLVDVNGRILDRTSMGEDLFWAIRGGGAASFGVVLAYRIQLVRVPEIVTVFQVEKTGEQDVTDAVYHWQHVAYKLHEDLFIRLILDVVNASQTEEEKTIRASFIALFLGRCDRLLSIMSDSFPELGLTQSDCHEMSWIDSVVYWSSYFPLGTPATVLLRRTPPTLTSLKRKSDYVKEPIPKAALEGIWKTMIQLETPWMIFNPYGGKMAEIPAAETPFPHRAGNLWKIQYVTNWNDEGNIDATNHYIDLTRKLYNYMTPYVSKNPRQAFFNYRDLDLGINYHNGKTSYSEGRAYGIKYFTDNFYRLVKIKGKVDPHNFFRNEQSIPVLQ